MYYHFLTAKTQTEDLVKGFKTGETIISASLSYGGADRKNRKCAEEKPHTPAESPEVSIGDYVFQSHRQGAET